MLPEPMSTSNGKLDHAIALLRSLIEKSPSSANHRMRLLELLHANRRRYDYVVEAINYKTNCDLTFDTNWVQICEMGRGIDPGNRFFGKATQPSTQDQPDTPARSAPSQAPKEIEESPEPDEEEQAPVQVAAQDGSERRKFVDRRIEDRRKNFSAWFGEERRKFQQRLKRRRELDNKLRPKR